MSDLFFIIKCLIITVAIIVICQIRVGHDTLEGHALTWLHGSVISQTLQDVAEGAVKAGRRGERAAASLMGQDEIQDILPTEKASTGWFKIKKSSSYSRQKQKEAKLARDKDSLRDSEESEPGDGQ